MNIGEKIKYFRTLNNTTQKTLGKLTGIGESTIRKYELGIRNPKPAQIKKIANALGIGENLLLDIPLDSISLETIGDAMALFFVIEKNIGISLVDGLKENGTFDPNALTFKFDNVEFNKALVEWFSSRQKEQDKIESWKKVNPNLTEDEIKTQHIIDSKGLDRQILMHSDKPLKKP